MKLNHKKVWLAILVGSVSVFLYSYVSNISSDSVLQLVAAKLVLTVPFIILGAYGISFVISISRNKTQLEAS